MSRKSRPVPCVTVTPSALAAHDAAIASNVAAQRADSAAERASRIARLGLAHVEA